MNTGGETANILIAFIAEINKENLRLGGEILKFLILNKINKNKEHFNTGEISMKKLIENGAELAMMDLSKKEAERFSKKAKKAGIPFAIFLKGDEMETIAYDGKNAELVQKILDKIREDKAKGINENDDESILNEYRIGTDKTYFVDKDNPENYIEADVREEQKTFIVDKSNPNNNIKIKENLKNDTIEAEIIVNGVKKSLNDKDAIKKEMLLHAKEFKNADLVNSEDEIEKLKEVHKYKDDKKTMKEVEKQIKEVRAKQPKQPKKDKSKTKERGDR